MKTYTYAFTDEEVKAISRALSEMNDDLSWEIIIKLAKGRNDDGSTTRG